MPDRSPDPAVAAIARIVITATDGARNAGGARGMPAICVGFGPGDTVMVEVA